MGFIFALGIIGLVIYSIVTAVAKSEANASAQPARARLVQAVRTRAMVVAKRTELYGGGENVATLHYATFELEGGSRREFMLNGMQYGLIAEGDVGILIYQENRIVSFARTVNRLVSGTAAANAAARYNNVNSWHKCSACGATYLGPVCDYCGTPAELERTS